MIRGFLVGAGLLWLGAGLPAHAQSAAAQTETWLGCPAGHALETAPDPRILPAVANTQRPEPRLVVRCVLRSTPAAPVCPQGLRVLPAFGADRCGTGQAPGSPNMGDGSVRFISGGTSNTVMIGETPPPPAPPPSGAGLTTGKGTGTITAAPAIPACIAPRHLVVDPPGSSVDSCEMTSIAFPADRVSLPVR
jgi:hypothetical protein